MKQLRRALSAIKRSVFRTSRPALGSLDRKLAKYLSCPGGFFIEAGANDGYTQSNTYYLEKKLGWGGLLIEGIPELFQKCRETRPGSRVVHCALVSPDFADATVRMHFANLMSVVDGAMKTAEAQQAHIEDGLDVQHLDRSYTVDVPARTLESVLDETPRPPEIDFFSLDVEGHELDVLKGLNVDKYRPKYILVEARFFEDVNAFLAKRYDLVEQLSHHDYLYRRK
jgi:FkbM family methyltransferase